MKRWLLLNINRFLHLFEKRSIKCGEKSVFLTFDDGPEPLITEFVINELEKYGFKATFFCRGDNAEKYPKLLELITNKGHALGNHTYSHINSFNTKSKEYCADIEKAATVIHTNLFRPPWGSLTLSAFLCIIRKYNIIYWSLTSGDSVRDFDKSFYLNRLMSLTKPGDIILFHFCSKHDNVTKLLLPDYLLWLNNEGFKSISICF